MRFADVSAGQEFFDPHSGDEFVKISDTQGRIIRGTFAREGAEGQTDDFGPDEEVELT